MERSLKMLNQLIEIEEEKDVLRWGYSTWGIEKVTTEYKPK